MFLLFQTWEVLRQDRNSVRQYDVTDLIPDTSYIATIRSRITLNNKIYTSNREEVFCTTGELPQLRNTKLNDFGGQKYTGLDDVEKKQ